MSLESEHENARATPSHRRRLLQDPLAIRALAHPARTELLSLVGRAGTLTTATAAREMHISHGLASHHLRQLAKYGFLEQVRGRDRKERPWKLTSTSQSWSNAHSTPEGAAAVDILETVEAEQSLTHLLDWIRRRKAWPNAWRRHTGYGRSNVYLTVDEVHQLEADIDAVIRRYLDARPIDDLTSQPLDSVPVEITMFIVPLAELVRTG